MRRWAMLWLLALAICASLQSGLMAAPAGLVDYLDASGRLSLPPGFRGTLDPSGFRMSLDARGAPVFAPAGTKLFGVPGGCDGPIHQIAAGADGLLYLAGDFRVCEDVQSLRVAIYDPQARRFRALDRSGGGPNRIVRALALVGSELYIGGEFTEVAGISASRIARWNGSAWSALGSGVDEPVLALAASGSSVFVGGLFSTAGGAPASRIARWNGSSWTTLGSGVNAQVFALAVSGNELYVGGAFTQAGGLAANRVARWDGASWSSLGTGEANGVNDLVLGLTVHAGAVYAVGRFTGAGGVGANYVAAWGGSRWSPLGSGLDGFTYALVHTGGQLYVGGTFMTAGGQAARNLARWNGASWAPLAESGEDGADDAVFTLAAVGNEVYAGGWFTNAGPESANRIARWTGSEWSSLGSGAGNGVNGAVFALAVNGVDLYVGGSFSRAGGQAVRNIARWNGSSWFALGNGAGNGVNNVVTALALSGNDLYVAGLFLEAGGLSANRLALWRGGTWQTLGTGSENGVNDFVNSMEPAAAGGVHVGGQFTRAGAIEANRIAYWDGSRWNPLVSGGGNGINGPVYTLASAGNVLYAGGQFTQAGDAAAKNIARWNGSNWSALGAGAATGANEVVFSVAVLGSDVYAGGFFESAGGLAARNIARWNGSTWSPLGTGTDDGVAALAVIGSDLYVGGYFRSAGGSAANGLARWNGSWQGLALGSGEQIVFALDSDGTSLFAGGSGITQTPLPELQSRTDSGELPAGVSRRINVNTGGLKVAFVSEANDVTGSDSNPDPDIFVRDTAGGPATRASAAAQALNGGARERFDDPSLSSDGSTVVFSGSSGEIYLVQGGVGRRINVNTGGVPANGPGKDPVIRGPGPGDKVYFASEASDLIGNDTNGFADIFVRNINTGALQRLSEGANGAPANGPSSKPDASQDGSVVVFGTRATNLVPGPSVPDVEQIVAVAGSTKSYVSRNVNTGQIGNANSRNVRLTPDGRYGVFESDASNLVPNDTNGVTDVFRFERSNGQVTAIARVSVSRYGIQANGPSRNPSISDDGEYVTFETDASNLIELDTNRVTDILVRRISTGEMLRLSRTVDNTQPNGRSEQPVISGDGSTIVFGSAARNLTPNDTNDARDVFSVRLREPSPAVVVTGPQDEPSLSGFALPTPNPPNAFCPAGFFIASVDDGPGSGLTPGIFGVELLLDAPGTRLLDGGLNFGGLIDAGQVGFAGFNFTNPANELQRVTLSLTGNPASSTSGSLPVRISLIRQTTAGNTTMFDTTRSINLTTPYVTSIDLTPGFYVATVAATGGTVGGAAEGQFFLGMQTSFVNRPGGGFQGGAVVGGYHAQNPAGGPSGFAGFCLGTQHSTSIRVLSRPTYGETGAKDLRLRLQDAQQRVLVDVPAG